jgi:uncharacterized protein (TIGR01777 family)
MRVMVTGGTGLIGRALTGKLVERGDEVVILSRSPEKAKGFPAGVQLAGWDGKTTNGWGDLVNQVDAIVNLAGASIAGDGLFPQRWTEKRKDLIYSSRMQAGTAVLDAIKRAEHKPKALVQSSAIGFYGFHDDRPFDESEPPGMDFLAELSIDWEAATREVENLGVRRAVIRTGLVLSDKGGVIPLFKLQFGLFAGGRMGDGRQIYSWIHIDDEVGAILFLLDNEHASGVFNLTAPEPVSNKDFARALGKAMKRPVWLPLPAFVLRLALGEVAELSLKGQRVLPQRLLDAGYQFWYPAIDDAVGTLVGKG